MKVNRLVIIAVEKETVPLFLKHFRNKDKLLLDVGLAIKYVSPWATSQNSRLCLIGRAAICQASVDIPIQTFPIQSLFLAS